MVELTPAEMLAAIQRVAAEPRLRGRGLAVLTYLSTRVDRQARPFRLTVIAGELRMNRRELVRTVRVLEGEGWLERGPPHRLPTGGWLQTYRRGPQWQRWV